MGYARCKIFLSRSELDGIAIDYKSNFNSEKIDKFIKFSMRLQLLGFSTLKCGTVF